MLRLESLPGQENMIIFFLPILRSLQWLPIKFRISYKILLLAYKALNGLASLTSLLARYNPLKEVELFHIWLPNSGIAFLITFGAQIHSLCKNLDERNSLAKHSFNASHNLVLQLHLIKCTLLLCSLGWTIHFYLVGTAAMLLCLYLCLGFCHRINIRWWQGITKASFWIQPLNDLRWPNTWEEKVPTPQRTSDDANPETTHRTTKFCNKFDCII